MFGTEFLKTVQQGTKLCGVAFALTLVCGQPVSAQDLTGYTKTFDEEFNSLSASPPGGSTTWETNYYYNPDRGGSYDYLLDPSSFGLGQTPFSISSGVLTINTRDTSPQLQVAGVTASWTDGQLDTHQTFSQMYGYFEARAKISGVPGAGCAFWLMPLGGVWPPEIDVAEVQGQSPNYLLETNHYGNQSLPPNDPNYALEAHQYTTVSDLSQGFHRYGLLWTPTTLTWYLDGTVMWTTPTTWDEHQKFYILLSTYAGDWWGTPGYPFSADYQIDYVRAYQLPSSVKYEAENGTLSICSTDNQYWGWTGTGYVTRWNIGASDSIPVTVAAAGSHKVDFRYSNGSGVNQTMAVYVNGRKATDITFPYTGDWDTTWGTVTPTVTLNKGNNTIALKCQAGADSGICDFDSITVH